MRLKRLSENQNQTMNNINLIYKRFVNAFIFVWITQSSQKELAKLRETEEKIRRAKDAQEKREREKKEKMARKKALVDITAGKRSHWQAIAGRHHGLEGSETMDRQMWSVVKCGRVLAVYVWVT